MTDCFVVERPAAAVAVVPLVGDELARWLENAGERDRAWVRSSGFDARPGTHLLVPGDDGSVAAVLAGVGSGLDPWALAQLPTALPPGDYYLDRDLADGERERLAVGWGLGAYAFERYRERGRAPARLVLDSPEERAAVAVQVDAVNLVRDLVNTPAGDLLPSHLAAAASDLAREHGAGFEEIVGDALLAAGYPAVHAVGRASEDPPRLLDLRWGDASHPRLTLVGKGVCFDSGGLDLKTAAGMRLMKKDMGGAAHAMGLARMVMESRLPVRLRVLVPAVENAVSGRAYRPGDVLATRRGLTVEIENTDAEGRLVLCDALAAGGEDKPDLMIDFATLTGAARVALGPDVPALFTNDDGVASGLLAHAERASDPIWRLPLHHAYRDLLESKVAHLANASKGPYAGAVTAALFLAEFVPAETRWVHFDVMAWNIRARPGRPEGGEAMGLRAVFKYLADRYRT